MVFAGMKLAELLRDFRFAMLVTVGPQGDLHSRPVMASGRHVGSEGSVWFLAHEKSPTVRQLLGEKRANVAYADPDRNRYVSLTGSGQLVLDRRKAEELWSPEHLAWFPGGIDDPDLALIRVDVETVESWDAERGEMVAVPGLSRAAVATDHGKVDYAG